MNHYKIQVEAIWEKAYFFQNEIEKAIIKSGGKLTHTWCSIDSVKMHISGTPSLLKIANLFQSEKYIKMFYFKYNACVEDTPFEILDWCSLYWDCGFSIHFEQTGYIRLEGDPDQLSKDEELALDKLFYLYRKRYLSYLYGGRFVGRCLEEDFAVKLCDEQFNINKQ